MRLSIPTVRFAMRQSLRWAYLAPAAALIVLLVSTAPAAELRSVLSVLGLFALVYALPHAATRLIEADRDGRLNHLRLAGHPKGRLLASLVFGWAGPWIAFGVLSLNLFPIGETFGVDSVVMIASLVGGSVALSLLALTLPRGETAADPRLVAIGLAVVAMLAAGLQVNALEGLEPVARAAAARLAIAILAVECVVSALCLRVVLRAMERPPSSGGRGRSAPRMIGATWNPSLSRALSLCTPPAVVIAIMIAALLLVLRYFVPPQTDPFATDWLFIQIVAYTPLAVGAFVISIGARADRDGGRLELLRLAPARPVEIVAALAVGVCAPFLMATLALHLLVWLLWGQKPEGLVTTLLLTLILAPVAGVEGWRRAWPLTYTFPAAVVTAQLLRASWWSAGTFHVALVAWIPWAAAMKTMRRPEAPPLAGGWGVAAAGCVSIVFLWPERVANWALWAVPPLCGTLVIMVGFVVSRSSPRTIDRWGPGLAASIVIASLAWLENYRAIDAVALAPAPLLAWWIGYRIHQWPASAELLTTVVRIVLGAYLITGPHLEADLFGYPGSGAFFTFGGGVGFARNKVFWQAYILHMHLTMSGLLLVMAVVIEIALHFWRRRVRR